MTRRLLGWLYHHVIPSFSERSYKRHRSLLFSHALHA